jgi:hypothetical protein
MQVIRGTVENPRFGKTFDRFQNCRASSYSTTGAAASDDFFLAAERAVGSDEAALWLSSAASVMSNVKTYGTASALNESTVYSQFCGGDVKENVIDLARRNTVREVRHPRYASR